MTAPTAERGSTPVPDPTALTTQALQREIAALKESILADLAGTRDLVTRLTKQVDDVPARVDEKVAHLRDLHDEKFSSVDKQFVQRDVAVAAALQAAEKAVGAQNTSNTLAISKSEATTAKQIDELGKLVATMSGTLDGKISDVKERVGAIENKGLGSQENRAVTTTTNTQTTSIVSLLIGAAGVAIAILTIILHKG